MQRMSSENEIRRQAIQQFAHLGYTIIDGSLDVGAGLAPALSGVPNCGATGRARLDEVVLLPELRHALRTLNPDCSDDLIAAAIDELTANRSLVSLAHANEQLHALLKDGIKLNAHGQIVANDDQDTHKTLRVIDWREGELAQNDFTLVTNFWVEGKLGKRCLDLVGFVNGLPLILLEIADTELLNTFNKIDSDYKTTLPALFWYNAFIIVADTQTGKMGSLTATREHFSQWKRVSDEREAESTRLNTLIEGTCQPARLLDLVENFTIFDSSKGLNKLVARNHQYLGVKNAIASLRALEHHRLDQPRLDQPHLDQPAVGTRFIASDLSPTPTSDTTGKNSGRQHGKLGVFWHTQGSGKSYSMVFFVRAVQRTIGNHYTFLVVTDRKDLDDQIYKNFLHTKTINEDVKEVHAANGNHLKQLLRERHLLLFTLIHKFHTEHPGDDYEKLSDSEHIIVIADEAHRTQYDTLAKNMRNALPRAAFIGFTGTPLMDEEEQTRETFGDYVSIYNFRRAINDGVTVPLYYENRTLQMDIANLEFEQEMTEILSDGMLDERQQQRIIDRYARVENFVAKGERLDQIAADLVWHFMNRGYMGKAMVVSVNKTTALRTYNRVKEQWSHYKEALRTQLARERDPDRVPELKQKIDDMDKTEMAVVISDSQGDAERFARVSQETGEQLNLADLQQVDAADLAENFKKEEHPLRIAFVCAMWMTGFDVPPLSTIYLDRHLEGHTLMQTIARVNRVHADKVAGLIVDYASNMRSLVEALAIYAREDSSGYQQGDKPIGDKSELVEALRQKLAETAQFCQEQNIDVQALQLQLAAETDKLRQMALLSPAIDHLVAYDDLKLRALLLTGEVNKLYKAILPDPAEPEFTLPVYLYRLIREGIYAVMRPTGIADILGRATRLVRESLAVEPNEERLSPDTLMPRGAFDLRDIDLAGLKTTMRTGHRHIKLEQLRQMMYESLKRMIDVNPTRVKHMEKLERAIDRYNEGCANFASDPQMIDPQEKIKQHPANRSEQLLDEYAADMIEAYGELVEEEQRHKREGLSEEDLAIFDQITLDVEPSDEQRLQVKEIASSLLATLRPTLAIVDWQKKPLTSGRVDTMIEDALFKLPQPPYNQELIEQKCKALSLYIRTRHSNGGTISVA